MQVHHLSEESEALTNLLSESCLNLEELFNKFAGSTITQFGYQAEPHALCAETIRVMATKADGEVIEGHFTEQLTTPYGYPSIMVAYSGGSCNDLMSLQGVTVKRVSSQSSYSVKNHLTGSIHLMSQWGLSNGHYVTFGAIVVMG